MEFVADTSDYSIVSNKTPDKVLEQYIQHLPNIMNPHVLSKMLRGTVKQRVRAIKEINKASYETAIQSSLKQKLGLSPTMDSTHFLKTVNQHLDRIDNVLTYDKSNIPKVKASKLELDILKVLFGLKMSLNEASYKVALTEKPYNIEKINPSPVAETLYTGLYRPLDNRFEEMGYTNLTAEEIAALYRKKQELLGSAKKPLKRRKSNKIGLKRIDSAAFAAAMQRAEQATSEIKKAKETRKELQFKGKLSADARELWERCNRQIANGIDQKNLAKALEIKRKQEELFGTGDEDVGKIGDRLLRSQQQTMQNTSDTNARLNAVEQTLNEILGYSARQEEQQGIANSQLDGISTQLHIGDRVRENIELGIKSILEKVTKWEKNALDQSKKLLDRMWTTRDVDGKRYIDPMDQYEGVPWSGLVGLETYYWIINDIIAAIGKYLGFVSQKGGNPAGWIDTFWQACNIHLTVMITQCKTFVTHIMHLAGGVKNPLNYDLRDCFRITGSILAVALQAMIALINMFIILKVTAVVSTVVRFINNMSGVNILPEWLVGTIAKPLNIGRVFLEKVIYSSITGIIALIQDVIMLFPRTLTYIFFGWDAAPNGFTWWGNNMLFYLTKQLVNVFAEALDLSRIGVVVKFGDGILNIKEGIAYLLNFKDTMSGAVETLEKVSEGVQTVTNTTGEIYNATTAAFEYVKEKVKNPFGMRLYRDDPYTHAHLTALLGCTYVAFKQLHLPHLEQQKRFILNKTVTYGELMWLKREIEFSKTEVPEVPEVQLCLKF